MNRYTLPPLAILAAMLALSACQPLIQAGGGTVPSTGGTVPEEPTVGASETMGATTFTGNLNAGPGDNGAWVTLLQGETLAITLESNRTTGYSWQVVEVDPAILAQQGEPAYIQPTASMPGQGGRESFLFIAKARARPPSNSSIKAPERQPLRPRLNSCIHSTLSWKRPRPGEPCRD
jgi:predicted secreted protein